MSNVKVVLNSSGVRELMKSPEMAQVCKEYADSAVARLGKGYSSMVYTGKTRVNASVHADTYKARKDNLDNNSIMKAVYSK